MTTQITVVSSRVTATGGHRHVVTAAFDRPERVVTAVVPAARGPVGERGERGPAGEVGDNAILDGGNF